MNITLCDKKNVIIFKNFEMRTLSWIRQVGPECSHMRSYKKEAEAVLKQREEETHRGDDVSLVADVRVIRCKSKKDGGHHGRSMTQLET